MVNFFSKSRAVVLFGMSLVIGTLMTGMARADAVDPAKAFAMLLRSGQIYMARNNPGKAADVFAKALQIAPHDIKGQLHLAEAFVQAGQTKRAEAFLKYLLKKPAHRKSADIYTAALEKIYKRKPVSVSGSFAILPSSNIKNSSSETYFDTLIGRFDITNGGNATSGIGVEAGVRGQYRYGLGQGRSLEFGGSINRVWYDVPELRYWYGRLTVDVKHIGPDIDWRAGLHTTRLYYSDAEGDTSDRISTGLSANWSHALDQTLRLTLTGLAEYRDYLEKPGLSGPFATIGAHWTQLTPSGAILSFGGGIERSHPTLAHNRYWGATVRAGYDFKLTENTRAGLSASAKFKVYDTDFTAVDYPRRDEIYRLGVSFMHRKIKVFGATPRLSCGYTLQNSNIALYKTNTTDCRVNWSYKF